MFTVGVQEATKVSPEPRNTAIEPGQDLENATSVRHTKQSPLPRGEWDEVRDRFALSVGLHRNRITSKAANRLETFYRVSGYVDTVHHFPQEPGGSLTRPKDWR